MEMTDNGTSMCRFFPRKARNCTTTISFMGVIMQVTTAARSLGYKDSIQVPMLAKILKERTDSSTVRKGRSLILQRAPSEQK